MLELSDNVHGKSSNLGFIDTSYAPKSWEYEPPLEKDFSSNPGNGAMEKGVVSLKEMCCGVIADNNKLITRSILSQGQWTGSWEHVWHEICKRRLDSYRLFCLFADAFRGEHSFCCHGQISEHAALGTYLLGQLNGRRHHRIELFYSSHLRGGGLRRLAETINRNDIVLVELHGEFERQDFVDLMGVKNLAGLDVADTNFCQAHVGVLAAWKMAMESGNWKNLEVLCLGDESELARDPIYPKLFEGSPLKYLEGPEVSSMITGNRWDYSGSKKIKGISQRFTAKYSLAFKRKFLSPAAKFRRKTHSLVIEIIIVDRNETLDWSRKMAAVRARNRAINCYVRKSENPNQDTGTTVKPKVRNDNQRLKKRSLSEFKADLLKSHVNL